jgi:hypothetical protein
MADLGNLFFTLGLSTKDFDKKIEDEIKRAQQLKKELQEALSGISLGNGKEAAEAARIMAEANKMNAEASRAAAQAERERVKAMQEALKLEKQKAGYIEGTVEKQKRLNEAQAQGSRLVMSSNGHLSVTKRLMSEMGTAASMYFSIFTAQHLLSSLIRIRGEFDMQYISLKAILQSGEQATKLFEQIKGLAVVSPFKFMDLTTYAKQLSAYQIPTNELYDTTKRLADLSSGLGVGMDRIILAYGQVRSAAFLRGQELRQFTEAGIPMVDELAAKFTKLTGKVTSAGDVFEKISKRQVPFQMVKEVIDNLTNEGGKFYNMQEKQAESLKGKVSNLADQYDIMMNRIGESNDGILKGGVDVLTTLMTHSQQFLSVIKDLAVAYGIYKIATLTQTAAMGKNLTMMTAQESKMMVNKANMLEQARLYRTLTLEEEAYLRHGMLGNANYNFGSGIFMRGYSKLTQADYIGMASSSRISSNEVLRLGYMGKINQASLVELATNKVITQEQLKQVMLAREQVGQSKIVSALSGTRISQERLVNGVITARLAIMRMGQSLMAAFSSIFNLPTLLIAGETAIASLIQKSQQESQKIRDDAKQLSSDMKEEWNDIQKFVTDHPIEIAIKGGTGAMQEYIKEYEEELKKILPEDLANAQIASLPFGKNGVQLSVEQQLTNIKQLVQEAQSAKAIVEENASALSDAADAQGGSVWSLSDGIIKNFNDFVDAFEGYKKELISVNREDLAYALNNPNASLSSWMQNNTKDANELKNAVLNANVPMQKLIDMVKSMQGKSGFNLISAFGLNGVSNSFSELTGPGSQMQTVMDQMGGMIDDFKENLKNKNINWASQQGHDVAETFKQKLMEQYSITGESEQAMFSFMFDEKMYGKTDAAFTLLAQSMKSSANRATRDATNKFLQDGLWSNAMVKAVDNAKQDCIDKFPMFKDELQKSWGVVNFRTKITTFLDAQKLQAWQQELLNITGGKYEIEIRTATDIDSALKSIQEKYKAAKQFIEDKKPLMIRIGYKFDGQQSVKSGAKFNYTTGKYENVNNEIESSIQQEYIQQEADKKVGDTLAKLGYITGDKTSRTGTGGIKKDAYTEQIKRQYEELKKAIQQYNELLKSMGAGQAMEVIKSNFGKAIESKYLTTYGLVTLANDYIAKNVRKTDTAKSFGTTLSEDRTNARNNRDKAYYDAQGQAILNSLKIDKEQYKVYDDMFAKLGNARMASVIAFGRDTKPYNTLVDMLKARFNEMSQKIKMNKGFSFEQMLGMTPEDRAKMPENIQKLYKEIEDANTNNLSQLRSQFINAFSNTDDSDIKIAINENLRKTLLDGLTDILGKNASQTDIQKAKIAVNGYYDKIIAGIKFEKFKNDMNWDVIFSGLEDHTRKTLEVIKKQLSDYTKTKEFSNLSVTDKKTVMDKAKDINKAIAVSDTTILSWGKLYKQWKQARIELELAVQAEAKLMADPNASEEDKKKAHQKVTDTAEAEEGIGENWRVATEKVVNLSNAVASLGNSSSASLVQIWNLVEAIVKGFAKKGKSEITDKIGGIVGAILGILDSIGNQNVDKWVSNMANRIFTALGSVFDSQYSLLHYIAGDMLGAKYKSYDADMKDLQDSNSSLEKAINRLSEQMKEASTEALVSNYQKQLDDYKINESNMRKQMSESGANYSNGFLGLAGKKSSNSKIDKSLTIADWERISQITGTSVKSASDFWNLSSENMLNVFNNAYDVFAKIQQLANDGYSDAAQYMDDYIELAEKEKELKDELIDKVTSTTTDELTSGYASALDSMDDMTQTFGNNFTKTIRTAIINAFVQSESMKAKISEFQDKLYTYSTNDIKGPNGSILSEGEISDLNKDYQTINDSAKLYQDAIKQLGLYSDQTASSVSGGIKSITEETADLLSSYVNAIRADVSFIRAYYAKELEDESKSNADVITTISVAVANIAANTKRNADNTDLMVDWMDSITMTTSNGKALRT